MVEIVAVVYDVLQGYDYAHWGYESRREDVPDSLEYVNVHLSTVWQGIAGTTLILNGLFAIALGFKVMSKKNVTETKQSNLAAVVIAILAGIIALITACLLFLYPARGVLTAFNILYLAMVAVFLLPLMNKRAIDAEQHREPTYGVVDDSNLVG